MIIFASSAVAWKRSHQKLTYAYEDNHWYDWFVNFLLFIGDYALMVPIAIYAMVEVVKLVLAGEIR